MVIVLPVTGEPTFIISINYGNNKNSYKSQIAEHGAGQRKSHNRIK